MEYPTLLSTVDWGVGCRIHPAPKGAGILLDFYKDGFADTVTSAQFHETAASWDFDKQVPGGESVTHTFDQEGVYEYYCTIHGKDTMCGVVLVGNATLNKSLPCGGDGDGGIY